MKPINLGIQNISIHKVYMQVGRVGNHDESIKVRAGGRGGFKTIKYVSILTVYFPFLKIFLKKKERKREND